MLIPPQETLHVEFKSARARLPDRELLEAVVCLANAEGGELWLGVEDDGTVTGLHPEHALLEGLAGMIAGRTSPMLSVGVAAVAVDGLTVAVQHRDYTRLGAVHVRLNDDGLTISNPGGLVEGVTLANLLTTEPRPRNRVLADALKRIGLVERSGRGVDLIYRGLLRFGRPQPDYNRTDSYSVILRLSTAEADLAFLKLVLDEENRRGGRMPIDGLIALAVLREFKRITSEELARHLQKLPDQAKRTLEGLHEAGLVQAHGATKARSYTLSMELYQAMGDKAAYTRQAGFAPIQHEQMVLSYVRQHGQIKRGKVMGLCHLSKDQAWKLLNRLTKQGKLKQRGEKRGAVYTLIEES